MSFLVNLALVLLFSLGLVISGTFVPAKVLNFLDLFGTRGASLAFVMGSAVVVSFVGYRLVLRRDGPIMSGMFHLPTVTDIDSREIFGIDRGHGGLCPDPALTELGLGKPGTLVFLSSRCSLACWRLAPPASGMTCFMARTKETAPSANLNACEKVPVLHRRDERGASRGFVGYSGRDA